jgi:hypothetical protein
MRKIAAFILSIWLAAFACSTAIAGGFGGGGGGGGGSGTVNRGISGQLAYYASTGTALYGTNALPDGTTATTQSASDNSDKVASTAYVHTVIASPPPPITITAPSNMIPLTIQAAPFQTDDVLEVLRSDGYPILTVSPSAGTSVNVSQLDCSQGIEASGQCILTGNTANELYFQGTGGIGYNNVNSNSRVGSGTLSGGTATISNTCVDSNTHVILQPTSVDSHSGILTYTVTAGIGITVTSSNALDDNNFEYTITEWY